MLVNPVGQGTASRCGEKPARCGNKAADELVGHRGDDLGIDGRKRKSDRPARIADLDPAVNQLQPQLRADLHRVTVLTDDQTTMLVHARSLPAHYISRPKPDSSAADNRAGHGYGGRPFRGRG